MTDKQRFEQMKRDVENERMGVLIQNNELEKTIDELQNERTSLMLELDKIISLFENAEKEKSDLETKIHLLKIDDFNQFNQNKLISND
jgi:hypothetical protein